MIRTPSHRFAVVAAFAIASVAFHPADAAAQASGSVEALAPVLAAEDARAWQPAAFRPALGSPDSVVRRSAAMAVGRIGDPRGLPLLLPLLVDQDSTVRVAAIFALGLLRDTGAVAPLIERMQRPPALDQESGAEAITALARIGGRRAAEFFTGILQKREPLQFGDRSVLIARIALESWRLGAAAPVADLLPLTSDTNGSVRTGAVYSLVQLRAPSAAVRLLAAVRDADGFVRATAVRALTRAYADSARLAPESVAEQAAQAMEDADPAVRINAIRSLATFRLPRYAGRVAAHLTDAAPNVRVQAATALGSIGGADAARALAQLLSSRDVFAVKAQALVSLARSDSAAARPPLATWAGSTDWRQRAAAVTAAGAMAGDLQPFLADPDGRVVAAALEAWAEASRSASPIMTAAARRLIAHRDGAVRSVAADILARAPDPVDIPALAAAYTASAPDSFPDAAQSALAALAAIARTSEAAATRIDREFLDRQPRPAGYLIRRWAESNWPAAARRWGPAYPVATGRTIQDYREIARRYIFGNDDASRPHVFIEMPDRGTIEIQLLGPDAPLTVANFLGLVDRHYFDGNRWHRVVPNFVIQDGDRRGDGWGGPGGAIRDEVNRVRYDSPVLGMALSGPDTGAGQWFINLSPQPHLDGIYTVFGRQVGNIGPLTRVTQGDLIRTIRR